MIARQQPRRFASSRLVAGSKGGNRWFVQMVFALLLVGGDAIGPSRVAASSTTTPTALSPIAEEIPAASGLATFASPRAEPESTTTPSDATPSFTPFTPSSPSLPSPALSVFDVFTTSGMGTRTHPGTDSETPLAVESASAASSASADGVGLAFPAPERPLSADGAEVLLADARQFFREYRFEQGRALLHDVVARRPADDCATLAALCWLAHTAERPEEARLHLEMVLEVATAAPQTAPAQARASALRSGAAAASEVALSRARNLESTATASSPSSASSNAAAAEADMRGWIELAERLALASGDPERIEAAILARAHHAHAQGQAHAAGRALAVAEESGLIGHPGTAWLALRAQAALDTRQWDEAREALLRLAEHHPEAPETKRHRPRLALLLELADRPEEARRVYRRLQSRPALPDEERWVGTRQRALEHPYLPSEKSSRAPVKSD